MWQYLEARDFAAAGRTRAAFIVGHGLSMGIGIDWKNYAPARDVRTLTLIWDNVPGILRGVRDEALHPLRMGAGMMCLWGSRRRAWLAKDLDTGTRFSADNAARMFTFYAMRQGQLMEYRKFPSIAAAYAKRRFSVASVPDHLRCSECARLSTLTFGFDDIPELPHVDCVSPLGCRCIERVV